MKRLQKESGIQRWGAAALRFGPAGVFSMTLLFAASNALAGPSSDVRRENSVAVQAFADCEAIVPGKDLQLVVSIKPEKDWHIYWQNPGGTGMPTAIEWMSSAGLKFGRTQYPLPTVHLDKQLDETSYILEGEPLFVTTVQVPAELSTGKEVTLTAKVSWLACKKECIPGEVEVSLKLPVAEKGAAPKPANAELFKKAQSALPEPGSAAKYVKISGKLSKESLKPTDTATAVFIVEIEPKHHMQSHKPAQEELIPTILFLELTDGLEFGEVEYPQGHVREDKILGKLSEYSGKIEIKVPLTVAEGTNKSPRAIRGVLQYQICTDSGTCFPPQHVELEIPVQMQGGDKAAASSENQSGIRVQPDSNSESPVEEAIVEKPLENESNSLKNQGLLYRTEQWFIRQGFLGILALSFVGGVILNLMPCVLPVISLKILSFVRQAHEDRKRILGLGLTYCAGVMTFFGLIAILYAKTSTQWGEQFQNPIIVLIMAGVVTALALSLFGVFTVFTPRVVNKLGEKAEAKEGFASAYFTGVLATVLGTACTAPALGAALGAATKLPPNEGPWVFVAVGLGMAMPFLFLSANPQLLRFVPRPGPWMGTFEAVMGFFLLGTVVWLLNSVRGLLGDYGLLLTMIYLLGVGMAAWMKGKMAWGDAVGRKAAIYSVATLMLVLAWLFPFRLLSTIDQLQSQQTRREELVALAKQIKLTGGPSASDVSWDPNAWNESNGEIPWVPYNPELVNKFVAKGYTVVVDFTADWCANCKTNLFVSINVDETKQLMRQLNVVPFVADYTRRDSSIRRKLEEYGRVSVPLFLVFKPGQPCTPQILPELFPPSVLQEALGKAGPSQMGEKLASNQAGQ